MPKKNITRNNKLPKPEVRQALLTARRNAKMARSAHAYVRGNTSKFYEWLDGMESHTLPEGPAIWICGDCHSGNLGPVADGEGRVEILIRDLDQTVIGNPAHDLIRLGLSLATAARGSDLPGLTTVHMMEALADGYERAFDEAAGEADIHAEKPEVVKVVMKEAVRRSWRHLAEERIEDIEPTIPLGSRFWPLAKSERREIEALFEKGSLARLATVLRGGGDDADVEVLDAAYWVKGCSSLGRLRYAVLLDIDGAAMDGDDLCLIDIKEAAQAAAPRYPGVRMPRDNAERVVEGARHLSPSLGERMRAARLSDRAVVIRELLPQDMKLTIEQLTQDEAMRVARFLALVVGKAHARQMDAGERAGWLAELRRNRSKTLDAPGWLWKSILELVSSHAVGYLEHCRRYANEGK
ncbi:DUF2252 domain-containing protein [Paraburkholderia fungorum]|jgi:uncharacterized protein (DUF2252 family)|uniref:DUF2252 domain-containing protein n=1 Tax=Paraburkholderia fungorum TaxID=134537 RepID=A0AAP5Q8A8_9BURK|nr:DUF2252 domain-containing protein [Paraburkholderia fungorum]MDT8837439.1 DUF2252 domain-containing protein [Paraburkholderia fungorum]PRZ52950.1 uncharacterized protein (DUF2252 family) [Paraburkholderia fungorum]USU19683.1 DUF2252 domain-containing protein [Paraburkholderia fungorum]USU28321.1 DUF2252 domain-containing protein [Paraburkholderia fungorum]